MTAQLMKAILKMFKHHAFISHDWGGSKQLNHKRVQGLNKLFREECGLNTWLDDDELTGNVQLSIMEGIDNSACVVVILTKSYIEKVASAKKTDNCFLEFSYATQTGKPLIAVLVDPTVSNPQEWVRSLVKLHLGGTLYINMTDDVMASEDGKQRALKQLSARVRDACKDARVDPVQRDEKKNTADHRLPKPAPSSPPPPKEQAAAPASEKAKEEEAAAPATAAVRRKTDKTAGLAAEVCHSATINPLCRHNTGEDANVVCVSVCVSVCATVRACVQC